MPHTFTRLGGGALYSFQSFVLQPFKKVSACNIARKLAEKYRGSLDRKREAAQ